jgi:hypothetical protein
VAEAQPFPVSAPVVEAVERLPAVAAPPAEPAAAARPRPAAWEAHRTALERALARATEVAATAREEAAARLAEHAADLALTREQAAARVVRAERLAAAATARARAAVAATAEAEARLRAETVAREVLGTQLELRCAEAAELSATFAAERAALAAARAEALAARRVREAESHAAATLAGELEAERAAHAVTRGTTAKLAEELAALRRAREAAPAPGDAPSQPAPAEPAAEPARAQPGAEATPAHPADLRRLGLAQAAAAATVGRPAAAAGRFTADLDAAAAALRRAAAPPAERLRDALVSLAEEDPAVAGALLAQLLPAQAVLIEAALTYDLVIRGVGTYAVTLGGGSARVVALPRPRPSGQADLALRADPLALAEWLAGADVRIGRWRGRIRRRGRRRALAPLRALAASSLSLTEAARAGARLDPGLVFRALAHVIDPAWTRGHGFTVAQTVADETWYLTARDDAGLAVSTAPPERRPDATVTLTRAAFDRLLRDEPPLPGARPSIRGDRAAVATLRGWAERAARPMTSAPAPIVLPS